MHLLEEMGDWDVFRPKALYSSLQIWQGIDKFPLKPQFCTASCNLYSMIVSTDRDTTTFTPSKRRNDEPLNQLRSWPDIFWYYTLNFGFCNNNFHESTLPCNEKLWKCISWTLTVLLGDLPVLVVPHHQGHRRTDDITHHLRRLAVTELLRWLNVPKRQALWKTKRDETGTWFQSLLLEAMGRF